MHTLQVQDLELTARIKHIDHALFEDLDLKEEQHLLREREELTREQNRVRFALHKWERGRHAFTPV